MAGKDDAPWTPEEAYCAFACIAVETDGMVGAEEHEALMSYLTGSTILASKSGEIPALIKSVHQRISALGEDGALAAAGAVVPAEFQETTFRAAVDLTLSDADIGATEVDFLHSAASALGLDPARRDALLPPRDG